MINFGRVVSAEDFDMCTCMCANNERKTHHTVSDGSPCGPVRLLNSIMRLEGRWGSNFDGAKPTCHTEDTPRYAAVAPPMPN